MKKVILITFILTVVLFGQYEGWDNSNFRILDNKSLMLGTNDDILLYYDETTSDVLIISGNGKTNNEDLTFDFEGTANAIIISTSTGVTLHDWTAIAASRFAKVEIDGAIDYFDVSTDLQAIAAADIVLDPGGNNVKPGSDNADALGVSGTAWSDLFLGNGGVINYNAGDITVTHSASLLTFAGGTYLFDDNVILYNPVNDGNPIYRVGSAVGESVAFEAQYASGTQTLEFVDFTSYTASATADYGQYRIYVDEILRMSVNDAGLEFPTGVVLDWNATDKLTHSANTMTASGFTTWDMGAVTTLDFDGATQVKVGANTNQLYLATGGQNIMGHNAAVATGLVTAELQVHEVAGGAISINRWSANSAQPYLVFGKSRGGAIGTPGTVLNNDVLGEIRFAGDNGADLADIAASIRVEVDGAVSGGGASDMPGRVIIKTTADGAASPTEAVRWDSNQNMGWKTTPSTNIGANWILAQAGGTTLITSETGSSGSAWNFASNAIYDGSSWDALYGTAQATDYAVLYNQVSGQHQFQVANSVTADVAIPWTTALTIDNSANSTFGGTITSTGNITCNEGILSAFGTENDIGHLRLWADQGDDNADKWRHVANTDGTYVVATFADGSYSSKFTSAGGANGLITLSGGTDGVRVDNTLGINTVPNANVQLAIDPTITGSTATKRGINLNGSYTYSSAADFYGVYEGNTVVLANGLHSNITNSYYGTMTVTEHGSGSTITNLAQIYVKGAPTYSGAGGDITNGPYAIFVDAGTSRFDGEVISQTQFTVGANGVASGTLRFIASDGDNVDVVINTSDQLQFQGASGGVDVDGAFTANTINGLSLSGTGAMDIASGATVDIDKGLTVNGDFGTTLTGYGQANTITLYESLTLSDGFNMLLVAEDAQSTITMDEANFEVEGEGTSSQLMKLVNANNAAATVTVEGTAAILNQDVTSDATVTFGGVIVADGGDIYAGTNGDEENWLNLEIYCDSTVTGETTLSSVLPAGYAIDNIIVKNTTANEITALDVGFTDGGGEVVAAANFLASDEASLTILQRIDDFDAADTLYLSATNWNSANLIIYIRMVRYF